MIKELHDQHIHSRFSEDAKGLLCRYIRRAKKEGKSYFITCEHLEMYHVTSEKPWLFNADKLYKRSAKLCKRYGLTPLLGIEIGCNLDHFNDMDRLISEHPYDLVQLSMHDDGVNDFYLKEVFNEIPSSVNNYFDFMYKGVVGYKNYEVLSHFDYGFKSALKAHPDLDIRDYEDKLTKIFKVLIDDDKTLEINSKVETTINNDDYLRYILRLYKSLGGKHLSLSSDAHALENYCLNFDKYMKIIKEEGFTSLDYFIKRKRYEFPL